jgi:hypothetical protein
VLILVELVLLEDLLLVFQLFSIFGGGFVVSSISVMGIIDISTIVRVDTKFITRLLTISKHELLILQTTLLLPFFLHCKRGSRLVQVHS